MWTCDVLLVNLNETLGVWHVCTVLGILPCNLNNDKRASIRDINQISSLGKEFLLSLQVMLLKLKDILYAQVFRCNNHPKEITVYVSLESECKAIVQSSHF